MTSRVFNSFMGKDQVKVLEKVIFLLTMLLNTQNYPLMARSIPEATIFTGFALDKTIRTDRVISKNVEMNLKA